MTRTEVISRLVKAVSFDELTGRLEIEFKDGSNRVFSDIPPTVHHNLITAESPGWYYICYIRGNGLEVHSTGNITRFLSRIFRKAIFSRR